MCPFATNAAFSPVPELDLRLRCTEDESTIGLRDRVRDRLFKLESEPDASSATGSSSGIGGGDASGPLSEMCSLDSERSEGVGDGEITRGVAGILYWFGIATSGLFPAIRSLKLVMDELPSSAGS